MAHRKSRPQNSGREISRWRRDPIAFITEALVNPQTGRPFELFEAERIFLQHAFTLAANGDLPYRDILWSCIKKSGKSTFGALCLLYTVICLGGKYAEAYVISNDLAQAQDRIFTSAARIIEASPLIKAKVTASRITFSNGSFIEALAADYRGAAGVEPVMVIADELWGFTTEASQRLYEECCPTPTRRPSVRMVTSYAGFTGESALLEGLVNRGLAGQQIAKDLYTQPGIIAFVAHDLIAPWQTQEWLEEARRSTRPTAFMRQYENYFAAAESQFIPIEAWDAVTDSDLKPIIGDRGMTVFVGLDCSVRRDTTAIVAAAVEPESGRIRVVTHKCFRPTSSAPVDFSLVEGALKDLEARFQVASVTYDPFQAEYLAQRLIAAGIRMQALPQTTGNLTQAASTLSELILGGNIVTYPSDELREAVRNAAVVESARGMRLAKERPSAKIDLLAALSFACLTAVKEGQGHSTEALVEYKRRIEEGVEYKPANHQQPAIPVNSQPSGNPQPPAANNAPVLVNMCDPGSNDLAALARWQKQPAGPPPRGWRPDPQTGKLIWHGYVPAPQSSPLIARIAVEQARGSLKDLPGASDSLNKHWSKPPADVGGDEDLGGGAENLRALTNRSRAKFGLDPI